MDALLELLCKYRCELDRKEQSTVDYLKNNFCEYVRDLSIAAVSDKNPLTGEIMCRFVQNEIESIKNYSQEILKTLKLYDAGRMVEASITAFSVFDKMESFFLQRYSGAFIHEIYYRIRRMNEDKFPMERKELFHIPHSKNYMVKAERYSMPGHPCLYLASQPELCWQECGQPVDFALASFDIPQQEDNCFVFIDFSEKLMPLAASFVAWFNNSDNLDSVRKYLLKYLCTYPLRAACSLKVEHPGAPFIEEYVMPQLLLQWVVNSKKFDGIRYESCIYDERVRCYGGHNLVLPTKEYDEDGYDINLRTRVKVGEPKRFNKKRASEKSLLNDPEDVFGWGLDHVSNDFRTI